MARLEDNVTPELPFAEFEYEFEYGNELAAEAEMWEMGRRSDEPLSEAELDELALELLEVTSEAELDLFLGKVFKKVGKFAKKGLSVLGKGLKAVAPVALPMLGKVAGTFFGGPLGGMIGSKLGSLAGQALGRELAGEVYEDREFEVARRYVTLAALSAQRFRPTPGERPESAAVRAMTEASRRLIAGSPIGSSLRPRPEGRWTKRGRRLIIYL